MILVTGATGCLGSNVTRALVARGEHVAILRRPSDSLAALGDAADRVEHRFGDVRDADAVRRAFKGVRRVFHLAGIAVPVNGLRRSMLEVNVEGTRHVAAAALEQGVERLVHTSSVAAIGWPDTEVPADEMFIYNGDRFHSSYMETKWLGEQVIREHVAQGLDAVILNPAPVMAPGGSLTNGWAALVQAIGAQRLPCYPGGGIAMTTGADVVDAHLKAMARARRGERYIVNTFNLHYRELFETIARVLHVRAPRLRCPDWLIGAAARLGSLLAAVTGDPLRASILVRENVPLLTRCLFFDQAKAVRELGISQTPLAPAIDEVNQWCRRSIGR